MSIFEKLTDKELSYKIAYEVSLVGGKAYYVGGYVRDSYMDADSKDIDIEVYGVTPDTLRHILDKFGERLEHGKSFGVFGIKGYDIDISLPRKERNTGTKHTDFDVTVDPAMTVAEGAKRRDLTMNAMMYDILNDELVDPFNGKQDIESGIIRHVDSKTFVEDPLRVLRVAQFAARFPYMVVAPDTIELASGIDISTLSKERIYTELEKAMLKSKKPSVFFNTLRQMNQLSTWFPEVESMIGVPQSFKYHKEGDVFTHTMLVLDTLATSYRDTATNPIGLMLSALFHDLGKIRATTTENGEVHSYKHEMYGVEIAFNALYRITEENDLINYVLNMVENHMRPHHLYNSESRIKKTNKMFDESVSPFDLIYLAYADTLSAKKDNDEEVVQAHNETLFLVSRYHTYSDYMSRPYVMGRDLVEYGLKPGKYFAKALEFAHKLRLAGVDRESALNQTIKLAKKLSKNMN